VHGTHAGLLAQLALGGLRRRLLGADEAARQGEEAALGLLEPAGQQHGQPVAGEREHDRVGGQADRGVVAGAVAGGGPVHRAQR
jgi:hypothetical protein